MLMGIQPGLTARLTATSVSFNAFHKAHTANSNICIVGISGAIAIPLILIAFLVEHCHRGLIHFFHFYLKIVALALLRLLTRIPVLGHMFRTRWDSIADSASEYRRNYEQHVNELLSKDKTDSDDEFHNTLNKRVRWLEKMGKVSSLLEGLEGSDDDEMDGDGDSL